MRKISSTIVGAAGEYHVLSQLLRRGWIAALAPDGAPNMDILVTDENNEKLCAIQVKTRRDIGSDKGWHMKPKSQDHASSRLTRQLRCRWLCRNRPPIRLPGCGATGRRSRHHRNRGEPAVP